ncbi:MAG: 30S ribosomal protein S20 [Microgenomates group bacterium]
MPITAQALKKLRHDKKRSVATATKRAYVRSVVKDMRKTPNVKQLSTVFATLDKAVKMHVIHANKAARLKSRLSKLIAAK